MNDNKAPGPLLTIDEVNDLIDRHTLELDITTDTDDRQQIIMLIDQYKNLKQALTKNNEQ